MHPFGHFLGLSLFAAAGFVVAEQIKGLRKKTQPGSPGHILALTSEGLARFWSATMIISLSLRLMKAN